MPVLAFNHLWSMYEYTLNSVLLWAIRNHWVGPHFLQNKLLYNLKGKINLASPQKTYTHTHTYTHETKDYRNSSTRESFSPINLQLFKN